MKKLLHLFWVFFKIGMFTFGGGYAMVSLIEEQVVERNQWLSKEEFIDMIAIVQSFPGAIAINLANYIGRQLYGTPGAIFAVAGATIPSLLIILLIAVFYVQFSAQQWWLKFVNGLLPVILALIIKSGLGIYQKTIKNKLSFIIFVIAFGGMIMGIHPLLIMIAGGIFGLLKNLYQRKMLTKHEG